MPDNKDLVQLIKVPILIAILVTILRVAAEGFGAPNAVVMVLGVAWLHILFPIYFASRIVAMGFEKPFLTLIKATVMWAVPVRALIALTYVSGYVFQIESTRFQPGSLGPLGEDTTALQGFVVLPLINFGSWLLMGVVLAAITGGITLAVRRRRAPSAA